ncbi:hypothetical protein BX070DRAFT_218862 [Coemansia spiralis]|nr:hypothetical protein BX070DRAFT_218862 [Coemansia spiralis]
MQLRDSAVAVLHPLVLLNISEHVTRTAAQVECSKGKSDSPKTPAVLGALLGRHTEGRYELFLSFELTLEDAGESGELNINSENFEIRLEQLKLIFPNDDFLGWYVVSSDLNVTRMMTTLHSKIICTYPSALLLVFDASLSGGSTASSGYSLPVAVYETHQPTAVSRSKLELYTQINDTGDRPQEKAEYYVEVTNDAKVLNDPNAVMASKLVPLRIAIDSGEAERVATEHVANISKTVAEDTIVPTTSGAGGSGGSGPSSAPEPGIYNDSSQVVVFLSSQRIAVEMLQKDISVLKTYVGDVLNGNAPFDPDVLQIVQRVLSNKPVVMNDEIFDLARAQEETNYQMVSYLAGMTKAVSAVRSVSFRANAALVSARNSNMPNVNPSQDGIFDVSMSGVMMMMGGGGPSRFGGRSRGFGGMR